MSKSGFRISQELKEQIINRIKNDGVPITQAAEDHGISSKTIYRWLKTKATNSVSIIEHNKIKKENQLLKEIIGDLTIKMLIEAKKG